MFPAALAEVYTPIPGNMHQLRGTALYWSILRSRGIDWWGLLSLVHLFESDLIGF